MRGRAGIKQRAALLVSIVALALVASATAAVAVPAAGPTAQATFQNNAEWIRYTVTVVPGFNPFAPPGDPGNTAWIIRANAIVPGFNPWEAPPVLPTDQLRRQIADNVNVRRVWSGLPALSHDGALENLAQSWSTRMGTGLGLVHQNLGAVLNSWVFSAYWTLGENILSGGGNMTAGQIVDAFWNSPPHRANILSGAFNAMGVGVYRSGNGQLWITLDFGAR